MFGKPPEGDEGDMYREELLLPPLHETTVPPPMYPYPVQHQPPLEEGTLVTVRTPAGWLVDELLVSGPPRQLDAGERAYELQALCDWGAARQRQVLARQQGAPQEAPKIVTSTYSAEELWVYRSDRQAPQVQVEDLPPADPFAWYTRVTDGEQDQPPARHPRPARELPSLTGRRLRWNAPRTLSWVIALSEPIQVEDEVVVRVCDVTHYWAVVCGVPAEGDSWLHQPALHTLWAY